LALALAFGSKAWAAPSKPLAKDLVQVASVAFPAGQIPLDAALGDVDGDGLRDLIVALGPQEGRGRRHWNWYARNAATGGFAQTATQSFDLPADVLAFALADLDPAKGNEVLLLTPRGAYVLLPNAPEAERFRRLVEVDCLWQLPDEKQLVHWPRAIADFDGDGLADLMIPSLGGYVCAMQRRAEGASRFEPHELPLLPRLPFQEGEKGPLQVTSASAKAEFELRLSSPLGPTVLVSVSDELPTPFVLDADGDGKLELLAQDDTQLQWFAGSAEGAQAPAESNPAPVVVDERRALDVSFASLLGDVNGDGRMDWVLAAGDQRASKPRTQVLVHFQRVPGSSEEPRFSSTPDQVLVLDGFAGDVRLCDLNGDGRLDLSLVALRPDLLQAITQGSTDRYELEQYIYLNEGGALSRRPILAEKLSFRSEESLPSMEFVRDLTGDKIAEFFWRPEAGKLRVSMVNTRGERWSLLERPLWELGIDRDARLVVYSIQGAGAMAPVLDHVLVIGSKDLSVVEF